ncbi:MAG: EamA family transporter RarD [Alphaproteobacteria bacterium]|nr:EamA family transporter RarD [Alphaproteobacteria bacterium]MDA8009497.1 EamA family transporter RarD [Alphaproteobacteria bacterium]MDA8030780.1 EamA family transporter RarD [Alphaproteobacteria bacterium]
MNSADSARDDSARKRDNSARKRDDSTDRAQSLIGFGEALLAFGFWGVFPIYVVQLVGLPIGEVLAHRVLWSAVTAAAILASRRQLRGLVVALANPRLFLVTAVNAALLTVNWLVFLHANFNSAVLEISLGYYSMPLVMSFLGFLFAREKISAPEIVALAVSALGVGALAVSEGRLPWISISLATTFAVYGMIHKRIVHRPLEGLCSEMLVALPLALAWILALHLSDTANFAQPGHARDSWFIFGLGITSIAPLVFFHRAARKLRYITLGFMSYIGPSVQFVLAITFFAEPFTPVRFFTFACIWIALAIFSYGNLRHSAHPLPR